VTPHEGGVLPLTLPASSDPGEWRSWLSDRAEAHLAAVTHHADRLRSLGTALEGGPEARLDVSPGGQALERWNEVGRQLRSAGALASLMTNVHPDEGVRDLAEEIEQRVQRVSTDLGLDQDCYRVLAAVSTDDLDAESCRGLEHALRDFRRSGVDLSEQTREKVRALAQQETDLALLFSRNIRSARRSLRVDPARLDGLPDDFVAAHPVGEDGLVELTTEYPDYMPVRTLATDRELRRDLTVAFLTRAWPENEAVLSELLGVRRELAQTLGYADWPSFDAEVKMIGDGAAIPAFIDRISDLAREPAASDLEALLARARRDLRDLDALTAVDRYYYSELLRREQCDVDAREVRGYFDFDAVRAGLLEVTGALLGLEYVAVPDASRWHPDVSVHEVYDVHDDGRYLGRIYLDLHPREGKYSHAAQFTLAPGVEDRQVPEGVLVCNFPRGLMEHGDVVTLFHEFGHLVHHVVGGRQRWARFSGVATEWDFVEAPSQMLEEWAWDAAVLARFARDSEGRPIPAALVERMRAAHELGKALAVRTQMFYAAISYHLHAEVPADVGVRVAELQEAYDGCAMVPGTHFEASFGHLGGYTSAYYTYMWSQVIAKDLFSAFDPDDLMEPEVARRYRDRVLARGGSADAADLVADFLRRPYSFGAFEAWLRG
jgi:thimet oligopeptidase